MHDHEDSSFIARPIWHEDGDIILTAVEDGIVRQFRVHRVILRLASSVFRDMMEIPTPLDSETNDEKSGELGGCPIVAMDDSPKDLDALLHALYNPITTMQNISLTLDVALSILLLSDKYMIEELHRGITRVLQENWPLNRDDYLVRQRQLGNPGCRVLNSIKLIVAAQRCGSSELLPSAFYELAASRLLDWDDAERAALNLLRSEDLVRLYAGRERAKERLARLVAWESGNGNAAPLLWNRDSRVARRPSTIFALRAAVDGCRNNSRKYDGVSYCYKTFKILQKIVGEHYVKGNSPFKILEVLAGSDFAKENGPCKNCIKWIMTVLANKHQEMWENIPEDFELAKVPPGVYTESMFERSL